MENYQFIKQIGHGSYGEVWLVKCSQTRKRHVLKRIDLHQASKREQRAAHLEAKLLSTIKHPNIVTYLDSFHNSFGSLFIVTNFCEGGDLCAFIRNQNGLHFEETQVVHWFVQICLALKYLHDKNILHRNLKTRNIFLTTNRIIKLGDLGISKVLSISYEMTSTSVETPCYISPEIFAGEFYTEKSDVWALGCCLYEMATLKPPFIIQDFNSTVEKIMKRKLSPLPEMYSDELHEIICSMLNYNSEYRPPITQLLLNDYIRRYILMILQNNSNSPDSQYSENSSESSMEISKSNSELCLAVSKMASSGIQRSKSTCLLFRNTATGSKKLGSSTKDTVKTSKSVAITVPDVNGNGDGNDNSQHGRNAQAPRKFYDKACTINCSKNKDLTENDNVFKNPVKLQLNAISNGNNFLPSNLKKFEIDSLSKKQKIKGEISFQILNSLANLLYTARPENSNINSNGYFNSETSVMNTHHVRSFVDAHAEKQFAKKPTKTVNSETDKAKVNYQNNVCLLPQIKHEPKNGRVVKSNDNSHNFPLLKLHNSK